MSQKTFFESLESRSMLAAATLPAPTALAAKVSSASAIKLSWVDNAKTESGYKVERSTNGTTFSQINIVGANVTAYTSGGLTAGKKYYYRVRAYDAASNSVYSNTASATPTAAPDHSFANGGVGEHKTGQWYFDGVSVSSLADPAKTIPQLKKLHVGSVRLWFVKDESWEPKDGDGAVTRAATYKAAGFRVIMVLGDDAVPTYAKAKTFFEYVKNKKGALAAVDLWEIGNEPNRPTFWKGTVAQYVTNVLKAAWDVLHPAGARILGAGPTVDVEYCKSLVKAGYLKYVDFANFHPYGSTADEVYTRAKGAKDVFAGKPILFSEWNIRNTSGRAKWAAKVDDARKKLATLGADSAFYFALFVSETLAGTGGLLNIADYSANQPFYDTFKGFGE